MNTSANSVNIEVLVVLLEKLGTACLLLIFDIWECVLVLIWVDKKLSDIRDLVDFDDFI